MGNPTVTPVVENWHNGGFIVSEAGGHRSRDQVTLAAGVWPLAGTVMGQITTGLTASYAALGSNTGNGTIGAISLVGVPTMVGAYNLLYTSATAFTVTAPDGSTATGVNGTAFSALGIGFTITSGGTANIAGDGFTITVAGGIGNPKATAVANAGNTGNSTCSAVTCNGYAASAGAYIVEFDSATNFIVSAPNGEEIGHGSTGTAFSAGGLNFTITAGGTAFAAGDSLVITVAPGSGQWRQWDPENADGSQIAAGILFGSKFLTNVTIAPVQAVVMDRQCEVNASELIWPAGASASQIASGLSQLAALGIIAR